MSPTDVSSAWAPRGKRALRILSWKVAALVCAAAAALVLVGDACFSTAAPAAAPASSADRVADSLAQGAPPTDSRIVTPSTPPDTPSAAAVLSGVDEIATATGGQVAVVVLGADRSPLVELEGDRLVPTASWVKVLVVGRLLELDSTGTLDLTSEDLDLMERALTVSDDEAMNVLWVRYDGPQLVSEIAAEHGLTNTSPPVDDGQWGMTMTTARDAATYLASLQANPGGGARAVLGWLRASAATAADGFDQRFGLLATDVTPPGAAVKQGWMCCPDDRRTLVSAGVLADGRVVVLFADYSESTTWVEALDAFNALAAATT